MGGMMEDANELDEAMDALFDANDQWDAARTAKELWTLREAAALREFKAANEKLKAITAEFKSSRTPTNLGPYGSPAPFPIPALS